MTEAESPGPSAPLITERVTHGALRMMFQLNAALPALLSTYIWLEGTNGPPTMPVEVSPAAGLTESTPMATT